ncbi:MAG: glycosyltransferase family 4 protein [Elusimicrobiota bacterium]
MSLGVCMLISRFYPYLGGAEQHALRLSQTLRKKGINVFVVTENFGNLEKIADIEGLKIYRLFSFGKGKFSSLVFMVSSLFFLIRKRKAYEIIHVHLASSPAIAAVILKKLFNKKVVVKLGGGKNIGDIDSSLKTFIGRVKLNILKKNVDKFIAISQEIKQSMLDNSFQEDKIVEIPNGVETDKFSPLNESDRLIKREALNLTDKFVLVFAGRLEKEKNLALFIEAFKKTLQTCSQLYLILIGEGSELNSLTNKIQKLNIAQNVRFLGKIFDVTDFLKISDAFVLPSLSEGMPNALLEAMSCQLTVLASAVGGIKEVIRNNQEGVLFEPDNIEQMSQAILHAVNNRGWSKQLALRARERVVRDYSLLAVSEKYLQLYHTIFK